jgi:hypothetical protein
MYSRPDDLSTQKKEQTDPSPLLLQISSLMQPKPNPPAHPPMHWPTSSNTQLEARFAYINLQLTEQHGRIHQLEVNTARIDADLIAF